MDKKPTTSTLFLVIGIFLLGLVAAKKAAWAYEQPHPKWTYERCLTNGCVADILNSLSAERAAEAKLTTWKDFTFVWYRK